MTAVMTMHELARERAAAALADGRGVIVTIDGPAGTGKSTVARRLAERLGVQFLDTGAMYRAATALALDRGVPIDDEESVAALVEGADLRFAWNAEPPMLTAYAADITGRLRDDDVNAVVSVVSALGKVRAMLVAAQRRIGAEHPRLVTEGRDQGSVVFPGAAVKFYLDASPRVRAERRAAQLAEMGRARDVGEIEAELLRRDELDRSREVAPLVCPEDAVLVDTDGMSENAVIEELERVIASRLAE